MEVNAPLLRLPFLEASAPKELPRRSLPRAVAAVSAPLDFVGRSRLTRA